METLGKVPHALGGADTHTRIEVESLGEILPSTFAKATFSKSGQENAASVPFASKHHSKESLQVNQTLSVENAHLKDQVTRLHTMVKNQTAACLTDSLASDAGDNMRQLFTENMKLREQLRTANTQNLVLGGDVAKNSDLEKQYRSILETYQTAVEEGSALQARAEQAEIKLCMQVLQTEKGCHEITELQKKNEKLDAELDKALKDCLHRESTNRALNRENKSVRDRLRDLNGTRKLGIVSLQTLLSRAGLQ